MTADKMMDKVFFIGFAPLQSIFIIIIELFTKPVNRQIVKIY